MNYAYYQKINVNELSQKDIKDLVAWSVLNNLLDREKESKKNTKHALSSLSYQFEKFHNEISQNESIAQSSKSVDVINDIMSQLEGMAELLTDKDNMELITDSELDRHDRRIALLEDKCSKMESKMDNCVLTESCAIQYLHTSKIAGTNYQDPWKTPEEFAEFMIKELESLEADFPDFSYEYRMMNLSNSKVEFDLLFNKDQLDMANEFVTRLCKRLHQDYTKNSNGDYTSEESFTLSDNENKNIFPAVIKGEPLAIKAQSMIPHMDSDESNEIMKEIDSWHESTFGCAVNGRHIDKQKEGYNEIAKMTQQAFIDSHPVVATKIQNKIERELNDGVLMDNMMDMDN